MLENAKHSKILYSSYLTDLFPFVLKRVVLPQQAFPNTQKACFHLEPPPSPFDSFRSFTLLPETLKSPATEQVWMVGASPAAIGSTMGSVYHQSSGLAGYRIGWDLSAELV